ncbi:MAG: peptidase [Erythrobacter sp.]|nr:peptidase [Erythrobacter sp.]
MLLSSLAFVRPIPISSFPDIVQLRIIDAAGAGFPSPAQDWEDPTLDLMELLRIDRAGSFVFRVSGDPMRDAGFHDRDVVIVDRDGMATKGSIVIAVVDGGFVIRQLEFRSAIPHLLARNSLMNVQAVIADENVEVWGVARASIRDITG